MESVPGREHAFGSPMAARFLRIRTGRQVWERALRRATAFAHLSSSSIEQWMLWSGWCLHVGCDLCADRGAGASCWGVRGCHGYGHGCGCLSCTERQVRDIAGAEAGA